MFRHTLVRQLALVSAIVGGTFVTSASATHTIFHSGTGSISSFPNSIKFGGTLECNFPNLGIYIDTGAPYLVLTDKSALAGLDPENPPPTQVDCTETIGSVVVTGTGSFQQLTKSGTIVAGGGQGPNPTGLVVQETDNGDGTTTATVRFYVDNRASTDERARYQITFEPNNQAICADGNGGFFNPCVHKMGLPDPLNAGENEVTKGGTTFPAEGPFEQYVMEKMSVTTKDGEIVAFTDFLGRWLHSGSEDGTNVILDSVTIKGKTTKLRTAAESTLDILVEFFVGPVVTSLTGVAPVYVLSSAEFDATTITATSITVNGTTVDCRSTSTTDINGDGKIDWRCAAEKSQFIPAAGLQACTTQTEWTVAFAVQVVFDGKERTARDLASTFPINCN